jgi:hypothetical protein
MQLPPLQGPLQEMWAHAPDERARIPIINRLFKIAHVLLECMKESAPVPVVKLIQLQKELNWKWEKIQREQPSSSPSSPSVGPFSPMKEERGISRNRSAAPPFALPTELPPLTPAARTDSPVVVSDTEEWEITSDVESTGGCSNHDEPETGQLRWNPRKKLIRDIQTDQLSEGGQLSPRPSPRVI